MRIKYAQLVNVFFHNSKTFFAYQEGKKMHLFWWKEKYRDGSPTVHKECQVSNSPLNSPISMVWGLAKLMGGRALSGHRQIWWPDGVRVTL